MILRLLPFRYQSWLYSSSEISLLGKKIPEKSKTMSMSGTAFEVKKIQHTNDRILHPRPLNVGIVGLGRMGRLHFLNSLHMDGVVVKAVADSNPQRLKLAKDLRIRTYDSFEKMLETEELDAVILSLPNFLKVEGVKIASEHVPNIFIEKPFGRNYDEAKEMAQRVSSKGANLTVGVNYRYFDSIKKLKERFDSGAIGDNVISTLELIMGGPFDHPLVPSPVPDWWLNKEKSGGGALLDLAYHLVDLFGLICGDFSNIEVEHSTLGYNLNLEIEDSGTLVLKSTSNKITNGQSTIGVINFGWFSKMIFPQFNFRILVHGTSGYLSTDFFAPRSLHMHAVKEAIKNILRRMTGTKISRLTYTYYYASFVEMLSKFYSSSMGEIDPPVTVESQLSVMKIIQSAYEYTENQMRKRYEETVKETGKLFSLIPTIQ
jgi:myo-inositol 2-dehydrogenase/D-chiro-inositol 1-dehydrogenase